MLNRPLGVTLISYFYIFGAVVLLFTAIFYDANANSIGIAERLGLPNMPERFTRVIMALFSLAMVYGYMRLKKWGFWTMVIYSTVLGVISSLLLSNHFYQPYAGNMIFSMVVLVYTLYVKQAFFNKTEPPY